MNELNALTMKILSDEAVARDIINLAIPGFLKPDSKVRLIEPTETESRLGDQLSAGNGQEARPLPTATHALHDLLFEVSDGKKTRALIGIDSQTTPDRTMPLRVALMDVLEYAMQAAEISLSNRNRRRDKRVHDSGPSAGDWNGLGSGLRDDDMLTPVFTIVVNWNPKPWTAPRRLRELIDVKEGRDDHMVDNELLIVDPAQLTDEEIASCKSDLKLVFKAIKNAENGSSLESTLRSDRRYISVDPAAAHVIAVVCGANIQPPDAHALE